eukprot:g2819.t1
MNDDSSNLLHLQQSYIEVEKDVASAQREIRDLYRSGQYSEALTIAESTLTVCKDHFGDEHPVVASLHVNIGLLHRCMGSLEKAEGPYKIALKIYKNVCGMDHPSTATCFVNLASLHQALASQTTGLDKVTHVDHSCSYGEEALRLKESALGKKHPDVAVAKYTLAMTYLDMGESHYEKALSLVNEAVTMLESKFGENHRLVATALNNLGYCHKVLGSFEDSLNAYKRSYHTREKLFGSSHEDVLISLHNIAELYLTQGDEKNATLYQEKILNIVNKSEENVGDAKNFEEKEEKKDSSDDNAEWKP